MTAIYKGNLPYIDVNGLKNSSLKGTYRMIASRGVKLDIGAMSVFIKKLFIESFPSKHR